MTPWTRLLEAEIRVGSATWAAPSRVPFGSAFCIRTSRTPTGRTYWTWNGARSHTTETTSAPAVTSTAPGGAEISSCGTCSMIYTRRRARRFHPFSSLPKALRAIWWQFPASEQTAAQVGMVHTKGSLLSLNQRISKAAGFLLEAGVA